MTGPETTLPSPLPQRTLTSDPGIGGTLKVRPDDFMVDEIPVYEPSGTGEHLYLGIQKSGVSHGELISTLRRFFDVPERAIGFAGMKDKQAVTRQTISLHLHDDPPSVDIPHERISVLWAQRHTNKIRRGHLVGNRFVIRVRDVDPVHTPRAMRILSRLEATGVPCYFGEQRFGYRANNHVAGSLLLREQYDALLDELLGTTGTPFPEYQRERRELYHAGEYAAAHEQWTRADRTELILLSALRKGLPPHIAIRRVGRTQREFWVEAMISAVYNALLDERIDAGTFDQLLPGDLAWKHDSRAMFPVDDALVASGELTPRLAALEISPSGPRWGREMRRAAGAVDAAECAMLDRFDTSIELLTTSRHRSAGGRRPYRAPITNIEVDGGFDDHGPYIRCAFDLPRGAYATIAMREVMGDSAAIGDTDAATDDD